MNFTYTKIMLTIVIILIIVFLVYKFVTRPYQFGDIIGTFDGVKAYSNQRDETHCKDANYYNDVYTGIKWQCVEFVRRYLIIKHGITFSDVNSAFEIPHAKFTKLNGDPIKMTNHLKVGSLIIWASGYEKGSSDGHVAIVSFVTPFGITVVEQNYIDTNFHRFIEPNKLQNVTIIGTPL